MWTAAASESRAARAAQTQESMPPLSRTMARDGVSLIGLNLHHIYETVGCVKCFRGIRGHALETRAPFRSSRKGFAIVNPKARLLIVRSELSVRPKHLSDLTSTMIMTANSLSEKGAGRSNQRNGALRHTTVVIELPHVRTGLRRSRRRLGVAPQPVQTHGQLARHGGDGDVALPPHVQVNESAPPLRIAAHRRLRRFH